MPRAVPSTRLPTPVVLSRRGHRRSALRPPAASASINSYARWKRQGKHERFLAMSRAAPDKNQSTPSRTSCTEQQPGELQLLTRAAHAGGHGGDHRVSRLRQASRLRLLPGEWEAACVLVARRSPKGGQALLCEAATETRGLVIWDFVKRQRRWGWQS